MALEFELLKTACYFTRLDAGALESIQPYVFEKHVENGEIVFWEGEDDPVIYFVIKGLLKLFTTSAEGREFIIRIVYGGDSINDDNLFDGNTNGLSSMTMSPVLLYGIHKKDIEDILQLYPMIGRTIAEVFAARERYLVQLATELVFNNVTSRLAHFLLEKEKLGRSGINELKITQQEMASIIGTVRELVSRSLRELEAMGAINLDQNRIIVRNKEQLESLSNA